MKKALFLGVVALAILAGCNSSSSKQETQTDSIAAPVDTFDVQAFNSFTTSDLNTFELKGHVKKVVETTGKEEKVVIVFSKEGEAKVVKFLESDGVIGRDKNNRISTIGTIIDESKEGSYYRFEYNKDGYVTALDQVIPNYFMTYRTENKKLNENGWPTEYFSQGGEGDFMNRTTESVTYPEIDAVGNWTSKHSVGESKTTEIDIEGNETVTERRKIDETTTRNITYYTREELGL